MAQENVNGVDVNRLNQTIENVKHDNELGIFKFRATNEWKGGGHCVTKIKDFYGVKQEISHKEEFTLHADEPDVLLSSDKGPNATEAALYALSSCLMTTFIYHSAARNVKIDAVKMELEGELDLRGFLGISKEVRNGYKNVNVTFHVQSEADDDKIQELVRLAQMRSPVFDIVTNPVPVNVDFQRMGGEQRAA